MIEARGVTEDVGAVYLHCDVDKMYYSVEALESPALADEARAVIISVDPREYPRAVVTTANGVARSIGITSGMSTAIATRLAREQGVEIVYVPPRHDVYSRYSRRLMDLLRTETPLLEQRSIDEAALDWRQHGFASEPVARLRERILKEIGLSVSFGLAANLLVAKMATSFAPLRSALARLATSSMICSQLSSNRSIRVSLRAASKPRSGSSLWI